MQTAPVLLANAGTFGTLFWLLIIALVFWYLIWLLLRSDFTHEASLPLDEEEEPSGEDEKTSQEAAEAPAAEPAPVTEEAQSTVTIQPSRAFTIWPLPVSDDQGEGATEADQAGEPEAETNSEPEAPIHTAPSQAFCVWTRPGGAAFARSSVAEESSEVPTDESSDNSDSGENDTPVLDTATAEEAAARFQADLESGKARQDEELGILFNEEPEDADDLKEIKGVAKVLEGKLHGFGIYKYSQIAFWTDKATAEFAQRLSFRDRIYRDDWIAQAKDLHEKKYGEKL